MVAVKTMNTGRLVPRQFLANIVDTHLADGSELAAAQRFLIS